MPAPAIRFARSFRTDPVPGHHLVRLSFDDSRGERVVLPGDDDVCGYELVGAEVTFFDDGTVHVRGDVAALTRAGGRHRGRALRQVPVTDTELRGVLVDLAEGVARDEGRALPDRAPAGTGPATAATVPGS